MNRSLYLFLDIDGVLNSESSFKYYYQIWQKHKDIEILASIDEQRLIIFHDLWEELIKRGYDPHLILSSTWRFSTNLVDIIENRIGTYDLFIEDMTPFLPGYPRGEEIRRYCEEHHIQKEDVIIFDDHDDMEDYLDRLTVSDL